MLDSKNNIFHNIDFSSTKTSYQEVLKAAIEKYWEQDVDIILQAINNYKELRDEPLIKNLDFFSSKINVENHSPIIIRFSKTFCKFFLQTALDNDEKDRDFKLSMLTHLEIKILNSFAEFLYKKIDHLLSPVKEARMSDESLKNINLIFTVKMKNYQVTHFMLTIPKDRIKLNELNKITSFQDDDFLSSNTFVKIKAGSSKITLDELKNISKDDILILENSKYTKLTLTSGNFEQSFSVKVNPDMIINIEDDSDKTNVSNGDNTQNEVIMSKNLWDDIQIEINAEFEKVKMTIGELKQITNGQVIDLGSIFNSEISLYVENKKVAKGELLIINDKYAVKLNEVLANAPQVQAIAQNDAAGAANAAPPPQPQQAAPAPKPSTAPPPQPQQAPPAGQQNQDDEEFDYSDFEK